MKFVVCIASLLVLITGLLPLRLQATELITPLFWPNSKLIPIQLGNKEVVSDGLEFSIVEFKNAVLPFYASSMSDWRATQSLTYRNASVALCHAYNPSLKTGVSIIPSNDWLGKLDTQTLNRYVASLRNLNKERFMLLNADTDFAPIYGSGFLLGNPYRLVHYEIEPVEETEPTMQIWDLIAEEDGKLIVLSFECPKSLAARNTGTPLVFLSSISRSEDLP